MNGNTEPRNITVQLSEEWEVNGNGLTPELVEEAVQAIMAASASVIEALWEERETGAYNGICIARTRKVTPDLEVTFRLDTDLEG